MIEEPNQHPIIVELWPLGPQAEPSLRVAATYEAYERGTGSALDTPPSRQNLRDVRDWLIEQEGSMPTINAKGHSIAVLYQKQAYTKPLIHPDSATKAGWLQQAPCLTCLPDNAGTARPISFAVRVRPFSAQSIPKKLSSLKDRISENMEGRLQNAGDWSKVTICLTVVAVVHERDTIKDVDNMAKGLLDALQHHLYLDDKQISHLSVHRMTHPGDTGHYLLFARPVLGHLEDVIDPELRINWLGMPEIMLD